MSDPDLGYYVRYYQQFGDGGAPQLTRVGPFADRESAESTLTAVLSDPTNKTDIQLVLRQEIVVGRSG